VDGASLTLTAEWYVDGNWQTIASGPLQSSPGADHRVPASCIA